MPATKTRTPRTGRPRAKSGTYRAVMFRWPVEYLDHLHEMAAEEERSVNTVAFRIFRKGLSAEGQDIDGPEVKIDTRYSSS